MAQSGRLSLGLTHSDDVCITIGMTDTATVLPLRWRPTIQFAARLRLIRLDYADRVGHRVTQDEMAELLETKPGTYRSWEAGNSKPADLIDFAQRIYRAIGVDPAWLLDVAPENGPETGPGQGIRPLSCMDESPAQVLAFARAA